MWVLVLARAWAEDASVVAVGDKRENDEGTVGSDARWWILTGSSRTARLIAMILPSWR